MEKKQNTEEKTQNLHGKERKEKRNIPSHN